MHRLIRDHLEEVLQSNRIGPREEHVVNHVDECEECRGELAAMREHAALLRQLRAQAAVEPRAGFYARVMQRIETHGPASIWYLFFESAFGRRIAVASMALALLLGVYLVTSEQGAGASDSVQVIAGEDQPGSVLAQTPPDPDSVLVNLVTYREQ